MKQSPSTNYYSMPSNTRQPLRTFNDTSPMEELQHQPQSMRSGPSSKEIRSRPIEPEPEVRVRYVVSVECLTQPRECPAWGKKCHKCGNKNHFSTQCRSKQSWRRGQKIPQHITEDARAKVSHISPGLEATR